MLTIHLQNSSHVGCNHCHWHCSVWFVPHRNRAWKHSINISVWQSSLSWMEHAMFLICSTLTFYHCSLILLWAGHESLIKLFPKYNPCGKFALFVFWKPLLAGPTLQQLSDDANTCKQTSLSQTAPCCHWPTERKTKTHLKQRDTDTN